jgi:uncharacterized protein
MQTHYLEIVSHDVEATCTCLEQLHGVTFSGPDEALGNARVAELVTGGLFGVRGSDARIRIAGRSALLAGR